MTHLGVPGAQPTIRGRADALTDWARLHARQLAIGLVVVLAAVAAGAFMMRSRTTRERRAEQAFFTAEQEAFSGNSPLAQTDLRKLIGRYDGTTTAVRARLLLAQLLYEQAKYDEGLRLLDQAGDPADERLRASVLRTRAAGLEQQGKLAAAGAAYLSAAAAARLRSERDEYKGQAARVFQKAGNAAEARRLWSELAADPQSAVAAEARVRLGELDARVVTAG